MFRSNRSIFVQNFINLFYEIENNLINPPPTYHNQKENERNSESVSPSPILFPRNRQSFLPFVISLVER
jgi:hypothetical protein